MIGKMGEGCIQEDRCLTMSLIATAEPATSTISSNNTTRVMRNNIDKSLNLQRSPERYWSI